MFVKISTLASPKDKGRMSSKRQERNEKVNVNTILKAYKPTQNGTNKRD